MKGCKEMEDGSLCAACDDTIYFEIAHMCVILYATPLKDPNS